MEHEADVLSHPVERIMTRTPRIARSGELASAVVYRMETHGVMAMPVVDDDERLVGVVHLHDLHAGAGRMMRRRVSRSPSRSLARRSSRAGKQGQRRR